LGEQIISTKQWYLYELNSILTSWCYYHSVEILSATSNSFTGTLPDQLSQLKNLREIKFDINYLSGSIPQDIGQAQALGELKLLN
jgi:hypothetical protein